MLYENGKYQEVLDTYNLIKSRQIEGGKYPRHVIVLTFAACYKHVKTSKIYIHFSMRIIKNINFLQNTPESYKYALDLWKELQDVGHYPMRKGITFVAGLALAQNAPHIALEVLSTSKQQNYLTIRNLKAIALADVGRPEDAIPVFRSVLETNDPTQKKHTFIKEAVGFLKS